MRSLLFLFITLLLSPTAIAADIQAGAASAKPCAACHGLKGISPNPEWPNLAGQKERYLALQIKAFRDGKRESALMASMVKTLSDEDAENLAAYFANLGED